MEILLILAVVLGMAVGVGLTTWLSSQQNADTYVWVVDAADTLSELEKQLNHFSEEGLSVHRILCTEPGTGQPPFVIVGRRSEHSLSGFGRE